MVFHEITPEAIARAIDNPRQVNKGLVDAQRRAGCWTGCTGMRSRPCCGRRSCPGLSAGRVQSVATRLIVQRERDRMAFRSASYWDVQAELDAACPTRTPRPPRFTARLVSVDGRRVATGRDFDSLGVVASPTRS